MTLPSELSENRLTVLVQLSQAFNSTLNLDEVLERVMDETIRAIKAERGFVMLKDDAGRLVFRTARGLDQTTISDPEFQVSQSVVEEVAEQGKPLLTSDALRDPRWSSRQSVQGLKLRSILCAPLSVKNKTIGVVYLDNRLHAGIFTNSDLDYLEAIASSAAIAIENARLYQVALEKARMEKELQMARRVQASLLPAELPRLEGWDCAAEWFPAREVAGDYYDIIFDKTGEIGLVVGDVTDKGLPAALFMVFSRSTMRALIGRAATQAEEIATINRVICTESTEGLYITLIYARLEPTTGRLVYVNAGHNPGLHYQAATKTLEYLNPTGIPMGIDEEVQYEQKEIHLNPGDFLFLYTDGIPDAINAAHQEFGMQRLEQVVLENTARSARELLNAVESAVKAFIGSMVPFDDITMMIFKRL